MSEVLHNVTTATALILIWWKNMWIEVKTNNGPLVIGVIYRHPTTLVNSLMLFCHLEAK